MAMSEVYKWNWRFMSLAQEIAKWSKDPSTQVGAVIVDSKNRILGHGFNGFPRGVTDLPDRYADRLQKYPRIVHAELNAILNSRVQLEGATIYCTAFPCAPCAGAIIQSGIIHVVAMRSSLDERWADLLKVSQNMFTEGGITYEYLEPPADSLSH